MYRIGTDIRVNATKIIVMYLFRGCEDICKGKKCLSVVLFVSAALTRLLCH